MMNVCFPLKHLDFDLTLDMTLLSFLTDIKS